MDYITEDFYYIAVLLDYKISAIPFSVTRAIAASYYVRAYIFYILRYLRFPVPFIFSILYFTIRYDIVNCVTYFFREKERA
ncbi:MAG: hypothetical protein IJR33_09995, partial [Clostridia bacterium]|nr:hypothetical protein [Clostridia bacterium]